jgi:hypothetical protein
MSPSTADKFFQLLYEYRYLALAGRAWRHFGPDGTPKEQRSANALQPGIGVLIQDSLLAHARVLIDFYTKASSPNTDIVVSDFGFPSVSATMTTRLIRYKHPIEVHLLHLTVWRDRDYRASQRTAGSGRQRQRVDWNRHNDRIVVLLVQALRTVSRRRSSDWHEPFQHLHRSVNAILNDEASDLPANLLEKRAVEAYLQDFGLS